MKRIAIVVLITTSLSVLLLLLASSKTEAQLNAPVILSAGVDANNNKLKIGGINFAGSPRVTLGTVALNTQSSTATEIVADLGNSGFLPGSYVLKTQFSNGTFSVFALSMPVSIGCGMNPPAINASVSAPAFTVGQIITISMQIIDPNEQTCGPQPITVKSTFLGVPAGSGLVALANDSSTSPFFVPDAAGVYAIGITATNSAGHGTQQTLFVTVLQ